MAARETTISSSESIPSRYIGGHKRSHSDAAATDIEIKKFFENAGKR